MSERLYHLRQEQGVFETGLAQGKQLLLATTVHEILLHWFAPGGEFLGLERHHLMGHGEQVELEVAALKEKIGFIPKDIAICKFASEEAAIEDLPGEYEHFLQNPHAYGPGDHEAFERYIREWRLRGCFVLDFTEQYWISAEGEVEAS